MSEICIPTEQAYRLGHLGIAIQRLDALIMSGTLSPSTAEHFERWVCRMLEKMDQIVTVCVEDAKPKKKRVTRRSR